MRTFRAGRAALVLLAMALVPPLLGACGPGGVVVTFRPEEGARYSYRIEVASTSVVDVAGHLPDREEDRAVLEADHEVLAHGPRGTRVRVRLRPTAAPGDATRTFVVTLDRSARLAEVERVEDIPAEALGDLGLSEIFPVAAGLPPDRRLRPGEAWNIDEEVSLPDGARGRLRGRGRLVELRVVDGTKAAVVTTEVSLAVRRTPNSTLAGTQTTTSRSVHAISDGSVIESRSESAGDFTVEIAPPEGDSEPVNARLAVDVVSTTTLR